MRIVAAVLSMVSISYGSISDDLTASNFGFWILGGTSPITGKPIAVAHGAPDEDYIVMGYASAFYWETKDGIDGEGSVTMWIYDAAQIGPASGNGPYWGLRSTDLGQVMVVGILRSSFMLNVAYHPWSSVDPFSWSWFRDGVRGSYNVPFSAGWYKWTIDGTMSSITYTLHDVLAYACNGSPCRITPPEVRDVTETYNANSFGRAWAGVFSFGWSGLAFKGEYEAGPENFYVQIVSGTGVFKDVGGGVTPIVPTETSSWGAIKGFYQ